MSDSNDLPDSLFWNFTLGVYGHPGVSQACIGLQDRHGLNVNMLIFCLWAGSHGQSLAVGELERLEAALTPWDEAVVKPLRAVRRWLKAQDLVPREQAEPLGRAILGREIESEGLAQRLMERSLPLVPGKGDAKAAASNLLGYLGLRAVSGSDSDRADLAVLLRGAFPDLDEADAGELLAD